MKKIAFLSLLAAMFFGASGCIYYTDNPAPRTISGQVIREDNGAPVPHATVLFYSGRKYVGMSTNHGVDAFVQADVDGKFSIVDVPLKSKVGVIIVKDGYVQSYRLQPFPESNILNGEVFRFHYTGDSRSKENDAK